MPVPFWGEIAGIVAAALWGIASILVRLQGSRLNAVVINSLRMGVAAVLFQVIWPFTGGPRAIPTEALVFILSSLIFGMGAGDTLYFASIQRIGIARAMPISASYPVLTAILAVLIFGEPMSLVVVGGIAVVLLGVYLVAVPTRSHSLHDPPPPMDWQGVAMAAGSAACFSVATLSLRPAVELVDPITVNAVRTPAAALLLGLYAWRTGTWPRRVVLDRRVIGLVVATGILSTASATLFVESVGAAGAARAAVLSATSPAVAVPVSILFLGERASVRLVLGGILSIAGIVMVTLGSIPA